MTDSTSVSVWLQTSNFIKYTVTALVTVFFFGDSMKSYKTVNETYTFELTEKHSRFIATLAHIDDEQAALSFLNDMRSKYWDAKHNVYAYSLSSGTKRFSDDSEPHGTAGKPVLDIIEGNGLDNVIIVVTRYFGGILLGTGGLVRAYSGAAAGVIENAEILTMKQCIKTHINCEYSQYENLVKLISGYPANILSTDYNEKIGIDFYLDIEQKVNFEAQISDTFLGSVLPQFSEEIFFPIK